MGAVDGLTIVDWVVDGDVSFKGDADSHEDGTGDGDIDAGEQEIGEELNVDVRCQLETLWFVRAPPCGRGVIIIVGGKVSSFGRFSWTVSAKRAKSAPTNNIIVEHQKSNIVPPSDR